MLLNNIQPGEHLKQFIRFYRIIDFDFTRNPETEAPVKAYRPRIEHCLQFVPFDQETTAYQSGKKIRHRVALFGQHTVLTHRKVGKRFLNFQIVFQPGVLSSILKFSAGELTNVYTDAEFFFGKEVYIINEQLATSKDYLAMIVVIERFLTIIFRKQQPVLHPVTRVIQQLSNPNAFQSITWYANQANLCYRQFDRAFIANAGIAPKDFRNLVKLDLAYLLKNRYPQRDWPSIAIESGFYDYQHLSRNYKKFTGYSPTAFDELEQQAPERHFGDFEQ